MANIEDFRIPLYSKFFHASLKKSLVFANLCGRTYQGQLSGYGKSITENGIAAPTITSYTPYSTTLTPEDLTDDGGRTLSVNQYEVFNFSVEDIDNVQDMPKVAPNALIEAVYGIRDKIDSYVADMVATSSGLIVSGLGTCDVPIEINSDNVIEYLLTLGQKLDEANVPDMGRYVVIPPFLATKLYLASIVTMQDSAVFTNGFLGRALGFDIYKSNNCWNASTVYKAIAGYPGSMEFVDQYSNLETLRESAAVATIYRGQAIFGSSIWRPGSLAVLTCASKAEA